MRLYSKPINIYVFTRLIIKLYNIDTLLNDYINIFHRTIHPKKVDIHFSLRTKSTYSGETFISRSYFRLKLGNKKAYDVRS